MLVAAAAPVADALAASSVRAVGVTATVCVFMSTEVLIGGVLRNVLRGVLVLGVIIPCVTEGKSAMEPLVIKFAKPTTSLPGRVAQNTMN